MSLITGDILADRLDIALNDAGIRKRAAALGPVVAAPKRRACGPITSSGSSVVRRSADLRSAARQDTDQLSAKASAVRQL